MVGRLGNIFFVVFFSLPVWLECESFAHEEPRGKVEAFAAPDFRLFGKVDGRTRLSPEEVESVFVASQIRYTYILTPTPRKQSMVEFLAVLRDLDNDVATVAREILTVPEFWRYPIALRNDRPLTLDAIQAIDASSRKVGIHGNSEVVLLKSFILCEYFERKKGWGRTDDLDPREEKALSEAYSYFHLLQKDKELILQSWGFVMESYLRAITRDFPAARLALKKFRSYETTVPCLEFVSLLERSLRRASEKRE